METGHPSVGEDARRGECIKLNLFQKGLLTVHLCHGVARKWGGINRVETPVRGGKPRGERPDGSADGDLAGLGAAALDVYAGGKCPGITAYAYTGEGENLDRAVDHGIVRGQLYGRGAGDFTEETPGGHTGYLLGRTVGVEGGVGIDLLGEHIFGAFDWIVGVVDHTLEIDTIAENITVKCLYRAGYIDVCHRHVIFPCATEGHSFNTFHGIRNDNRVE